MHPLGGQRRIGATAFLGLCVVLTAGNVAFATHAAATPGTPLTSGSLTMVSTLADGTSGANLGSTDGANDVSINDDGTVVAFDSPVPAPELVTDPTQIGHVEDTNDGPDVFVYQKQPAGADPIVTLVSWTGPTTGTTGNAPSTAPVLARGGDLGLVFTSAATDLVTGHVDANQQHIYSWVPTFSPQVSLVDTKYQSADACNCSAEHPSISMSSGLGPTVVFEATGGGPTNELVAPDILGQGDSQIYAHAVLGGGNTLVSVTDDTTVSNDRSTVDPDVGNGAVGGAEQPMVAADGSVVVFASVGGDLIDGFDNSNGENIWEHNLVTDLTTLVSASASGDPNGTSGNQDPVISDEGGVVAWLGNDSDVSSTPFFIPAQSVDHVFSRVVTPTALPTLLVDTDRTGALGCDAASRDVGISGDGSSVVFDSDCDDISDPSLVPDNNGASDVFERSMTPLLDAAPRLLSINDAGTGSGNGESQLCGPGGGSFAGACADLSDPSDAVDVDGTAVTFFTAASDIAVVPNPPPPDFTNGNVIVRYPKSLTPKSINVSVSTAGKNPDGTSGGAVISGDGSSVGFASFADDLVASDDNGTSDVFETDAHDSFTFEPITPVNEGDGSVTITVDRSGPNGTADSVEVKTSDGTATKPGDYTATDDTLSFPPGVSEETFTVPIVDDAVAESTETFQVSLSNPTGAGVIGTPDTADVVIVDDDMPAQDWSVTTSQQPTSPVVVGDTVTMKATISVDPGAADLTVNSLASGPATAGLDDVVFADPTPFMVPADTTRVITATARVVAAPGTVGTILELSVDGTLGAESTKVADSQQIESDEAVTATLTGGAATVEVTDQITYTLTFTNVSETDAQLTGLPAGLVAPTGTTAAGSATGSTTVAANGGTAAWSLTVDVDDADTDAQVLTQEPGAVSYGMSDIGLAARDVAVTPTSVSSTVSNPADTTSPDVTINQAVGQADPTSTAPVDFTAAFSEPVTGFLASDVDFAGSTVGGTLVAAVTGGPTTFTVAVSGMTTSGTVVVSIPAGAAMDGASNASTASTSTDHSVSWVRPVSPPPPPTLLTSGVALTVVPGSPVYGQEVHALAVVTASSGTPAGTVQFGIDGQPLGAPVVLDADGAAASPSLTAPAVGAVMRGREDLRSASALAPGSHTVTAQFIPAAPSTYAGSSESTVLAIDKAATTIALSVDPKALNATVAAKPPGAGVPGGTVIFSIDGLVVGTAPLAVGVATLTYATSSGKEHEVSAVYSGDANFTASSTSTTREDPTIRAHVSSAHHRTKYGWYRSMVTIHFICTAPGAPLVVACPAAVRLTHSGAAQSLSRTVAATDGGVATVVVNGINIDRGRPKVKVKGVHDGRSYPRPGPTLSCHATDKLSGIASCKVTKSTMAHDGVTTVHYRGIAKDKAGNKTTSKGKYRVQA